LLVNCSHVVGQLVLGRRRVDRNLVRRYISIRCLHQPVAFGTVVGYCDVIGDVDIMKVESIAKVLVGVGTGLPFTLSLLAR